MDCFSERPWWHILDDKYNALLGENDNLRAQIQTLTQERDEMRVEVERLQSHIVEF